MPTIQQLIRSSRKKLTEKEIEDFQIKLFIQGPEKFSSTELESFDSIDKNSIQQNCSLMHRYMKNMYANNYVNLYVAISLN